MTDKPMQLVDVEVTVSFACDGDLTWEQIKQFAADAIAAKLDAEMELEQWGGGRSRFYYNGECATEAHLASAL
jgi:hypothetical protein